MSEKTRTISRPKVRFSQFSDNVQNKEKNVEHKDNTVLRANGPKILSIVSLKKPVRIVDPKKCTTVCDKDIPQHNCNIETHCSDITSENIQSTCIPNKDISKIDTSKILQNANGIQNIKKNCNTLISGKSPQNILKNRRESKEQKGKENRDTMLKKVVSSKDTSKTRGGSSQCIQSTIQIGNCKLPTNNNMQKISTMDSKNPKMTKSQSVPSILKKTKNQTFKGTSNAKSITPNVMPCYKIAAKNKISPVKKTILRNVSGPKIKTSVGPGISHKKKNDVKTSDINKRYNSTLDVAKELAQPVYNSIACTLNKLKELKQQKIVRDIDHLSSAQKSFINGKVRFFIKKIKHVNIFL